MRVPLFNLYQINAQIKDEITDVLNKVVDSGWYILGNTLKSFEYNLKNILNGPENAAVFGCNSGTDALILALLAANVGSGDEVITVSHTAIPTITAICSSGARPIFIDIDPHTWLMDIEEVTKSVTSYTKAIIPVHLYGNMVDVNKLAQSLRDIGRDDIVIIEDVAQAQGATLRGVQAGTLGRYGAFSFYPTKNIGALGDGGAVFCRYPEDGEEIRILRNYGQKDRYHAEVKKGLNSRLDEIQAAVLTLKLKYLKDWNHQKSIIMERYRQELTNLPITFQGITPDCIPGWHLCVIALENNKTRESFMSYLKEKGIETLIHYPIPTHLQKAFQSDQKFSLPVTESLTGRIVSIPMNTALSETEQEMVIEGIKSFFRD